MDDPIYVITLIHGTFARDAKWTRADSPFSVGLKKELAELSVLKSFQWSGANSHRARLNAARELAINLADSAEECPNSRHFAIAHSHGGNLVFSAQERPELRGKLSGIVTLGTPFISCKRREMDIVIDSTVTTLSILLTFIFVALYFAALLHFFFENIAGKGLLSLGILVLLLMTNRIIGAVLRPLSRKFFEAGSSNLKEFVKKNQKKTEMRFAVDTSSLPPLLCITVLDDEASRWLSFLHTIGDIGPRASLRISRRMRPLVKVCVTSFFISALTFGPRDLVGMIILVTSIMVPIAAALCFLAIQLCTILSQMSIRAHRFGFGGESIRDNWFTDIFVSDMPPVACDTHVITPSSTGLRHSSFYKDATVAKTIASWITSHAIAR